MFKKDNDYEQIIKDAVDSAIRSALQDIASAGDDEEETRSNDHPSEDENSGENDEDLHALIQELRESINETKESIKQVQRENVSTSKMPDADAGKEKSALDTLLERYNKKGE